MDAPFIAHVIDYYLYNGVSGECTEKSKVNTKERSKTAKSGQDLHFVDYFIDWSLNRY